MKTKSLNDQYGNAIFVGNEVSFKYDVEQESEVLDIKIETGEILVFNENQMCGFSKNSRTFGQGFYSQS